MLSIENNLIGTRRPRQQAMRLWQSKAPHQMNEIREASQPVYIIHAHFVTMVFLVFRKHLLETTLRNSIVSAKAIDQIQIIFIPSCIYMYTPTPFRKVIKDNGVTI